MPAQRHEKMTRYRVSEYEVKSGRGKEDEQTAEPFMNTNVKQNRPVSQSASPTSRSHKSRRRDLKEKAPVRSDSQTDATSVKDPSEKQKNVRASKTFTIPKGDWKLWSPIFQAAQREAELTIPSDKHKLEVILSKDGHKDIYNQQHCVLGASGGIHLIYTTDPSDKTLTLLACRLKVRSSGVKERVATRTSIANHFRTGASPWSTLGLFPEKRIVDATVGLARDLPEDDDISFYEYPLRIAKQRRDLARLRNKLDAAMDREDANDAKIRERDGKIEALNQQIARFVESGYVETSDEIVEGLETKLKELQQVNLVLENQKRALERKLNAVRDPETVK